MPIKQLPIPLSPQTLETTLLLSVYMSLCTLLVYIFFKYCICFREERRET